MTSDTHGPTRYIWAGVIKPKRNSSIWRQPAQKMSFNGMKGSSNRVAYKRKHPVTLATKPFDHTEGSQ